MRIATLVISLVLMLVVFVQSCAVAAGESLADEEAASSGAIGILVALLFLLGGAFALGLPWVSVAAFALAAIIGLAGGSSSEFEDLTVWGIVAAVLAVFAYFGTREKRRRSPGTLTTDEPRDQQ